ncbi:hypothetical protein N7520_005719 [Penicillium odoratum]|uniref:uncharacterized protein n=1 Tax=Penicillium odoratum TaxID=1167516 RepID=UPI0025481FA2|nr:uncharacterized protein N7520_005719 [Penicillium odoratum]KAJ5758563.1 hypothetical protein N7520_005719 [Penicillium odoratum]
MDIPDLERSDVQKLKHTPSGLLLVPQPSNDPADPLNWPLRKKIGIMALVSVCTWIGIAQTLANQSGFFAQAKTYHKTANELSYSASAGIAGLATGPFLWAILAQRIGRSSCIFWGLLGMLGCSVWSACMTGEHHYIPFIISRWLGGTFGSVASTIGAGFVLDLFFLHQRGKAFAVYSVCTLFGVQFGPTLSGFIVQYAPWSIQFWWGVGVEGVLAIVVFIFLQETGFSRDGRVYPPLPKEWLPNRIVTFFPGTATVPRSKADGRRSAKALLLIAACPVTFTTGAVLFLAFGWAVGVVTLTSVFLETPLEDGGYSFSALQVACFTFIQWLGVAAAETWGMFLNDRIPLWFTRRYCDGIWKPENRLFPLLCMPAVCLPIALGLFGAGLQYHLHYMVLGLAIFLLQLSEVSLVPVIVNYGVECFTDHSQEVVTILNFCRLALGVVIPFFIDQWEITVGIAWVFGMMALFSIFAFSLAGLLAWKGEKIRSYSFATLQKSEGGVQLVDH